MSHTFINLHNSTPPPIHLSGKCPGPLHAFCYNPSHQYHPSCRHLQPQKQKCSPVCKRHRAAPGGWPTLRLMGVGISSSGPVAERYKAIWQKLYSVTSTATRLQRHAWKPERLMAIPASEWSDGNAPNPLSLEHGTTAQKRCTAYGPTQTRSQLAYGSYLRAMLYCPLRASEMANMRCSNVELDHKGLVLSALETNQ